MFRLNEPSLKFSPHHILVNDNFNIQVGPQVINLVCVGEYVGWTKYSSMIKYLLSAFSSTDLFGKPLRAGLRYTNVFEKINIFEKIKIKFEVSGNSLNENRKNSVSSEFPCDDHLCILQINNQSISPLDGIPVSIIDIDVIKDISTGDAVDFFALAEQAHALEKQIFFDLLEENFLKQFNPEY